MAEHRVFLSSTDISLANLSTAKYELSTDGGSNWHLLSVADRQAGLPIDPGQRFIARISQTGTWAVTQELAISADRDTALVYVGDQDFGAVSLSSTAPGEPMPTEFRHVFSACLSLFRDAMPDRNAQGNNQPPAYMYSLLSFNGANVLAGGGSGLGRLAADPAMNVVSYGPNVGDLYFIQSPPDSNIPQECAVFVPSNLDLSAPVPVHVFYSPSTGGKKLPYPYSDGDDSFNAMLHNYLISGAKRFLSQHVASGKSCVFVFPLPSPKSYFASLQTADSVRKFCLETVYYLRKIRGMPAGLQPNLGTCALSGFSEGGRPLANVIASSPQGLAFPELQELYLLDVMPPSGSSVDTGSYHRLMGQLNGWWASGQGKRKVRFYSEFYPFNLPLAVRGNLARSGASALEYQADGSTCFFSPASFWATVGQEQSDSNGGLGYALDSVHQLMPCVFLQHALRNSGFPDS
jgi:hypothetical protein